MAELGHLAAARHRAATTGAAAGGALHARGEEGARNGDERGPLERVRDDDRHHTWLGFGLGLGFGFGFGFGFGSGTLTLNLTLSRVTLSRVTLSRVIAFTPVSAEIGM